LIAGLIQGLLEWLPISSQGNLVLALSSFLGVEPASALSLSVYLHLGTGFAALAYLRGDVAMMVRREPDSDRIVRFLAVATALTGVVGLPLFLLARDIGFEGERLLAITGVALVVTGLVQWSAREQGTRRAGTLDVRDGFILGVVQGLSAVPGLSRSGLTVSLLLMMKFSGEEAFRVSFLMSIPAVFAAALGLSIVEGAPPLGLRILLAIAASFVTALISMDALLRLTRKLRFWSLCILMGALALIPQMLDLL
jgi:undecaprenyl-diphosphatase